MFYLLTYLLLYSYISACHYAISDPLLWYICSAARDVSELIQINMPIVFTLWLS